MGSTAVIRPLLRPESVKKTINTYLSIEFMRSLFATILHRNGNSNRTNKRLRWLENPFEVCTMIFCLICLLLLQAAPLTLGAPRRPLSPPRQRETILDVDFNGDGEDMVRGILNRPYSTRHNDGSDSDKQLYGVRFSESDEGRMQVARSDPIDMEALRTVIEEHDLDWALIEEIKDDDDLSDEDLSNDDLSDDGTDEVVRRVHKQGTLDKDAYSDPERRDVEDSPWNSVLRDGGSSEDPFEKPKFREGQGGFVQCAGCSDTRGDSNGWKRSTPFVERANTSAAAANETHHRHPADLLDALDRSNASPLAWNLPTISSPTSSSLQKRGETDWTCNRIGQKNTKEALLIMYNVFNNVFGTEPLRGLTNQCYVAECQDWYFSYCQMSVDIKGERPGARKKVVDRDPGKGGSCYAVADGEDLNRYHRYFFGHVSANPIPNYGGGFNVRRCN
ncbi:major facilitator superfamily transporter [Colletotrichum limetticola]|uniref:Major facilitator superfamily transporter n=1 Tax=Colletotrichum limetticola TaxID=1209924 RepID=A0ABQ9PY23_9PEZI|nr:major facilitator superfamily transporter [Colletotrichum limetticola]